MNIFTDALFLLIYIFTLFCFKLINIQTDNYLKHKFYLFITVLGFTYVIQLIKKIKNGCKITSQVLLQESLKLSVTAVVGYSVFVDLSHMSWSQNYFSNIENHYRKYLVVALIIVSFVTLIQLVGLMFQSPNEC